MKTTILSLLTAASLSLASGNLLAAESQRASTGQQVILLKLDDVVAAKSGDAPVSARWQRIANFIETNQLKGAFGIIGSSLETDNPAYFKWIKDLDQKGIIEFWNHGYTNRNPKDKSGEFELGSAAEQKVILERTQRLAKEKLGLTLRVFGQHYSGVTEETEKALNEIPDNQIWLYGPKNSHFYKKHAFVRIMGLENPTFVPDFEKFKATYERVGASQPMLVLQGHPDQWNDERWAGFVKIIEFLQSKGCVFMKPSEYLASRSKAGGQ
ncbi:MAG: hypothetical protein WCO56_25115 [Verrucomicrobiota bacterium]